MCEGRSRDTDIITIPVIWIADHVDHLAVEYRRLKAQRNSLSDHQSSKRFVQSRKRDYSHSTIGRTFEFLDAPKANIMPLCPVVPNEAQAELRIAESQSQAN